MIEAVKDTSVLQPKVFESRVYLHLMRLAMTSVMLRSASVLEQVS